MAIQMDANTRRMKYKSYFENEVLFPVLGYSIGYVPIAIIKIHNKKGCS